MASGNSLLTFGIRSAVRPSANYPQWFLRNFREVWRFDGTVEESIYYNNWIPNNYGGNGLTLYIPHACVSATSGNAMWGASWERIGAVLDIDGDSFASEKTVITAVSGTAGIPVVSSIAFTSGAEMDSLVAGEQFRLKIARKAADASDTVNATDIDLLGLHLKET